MFKAITIAGSDSGGGAGIQADLKTFASLNVYGASVITALTAQNTLGVHAIELASQNIIAQQIDAVFSDIGFDACKTGMLSNAETITTVATKLKAHKIKNLVVDPVMVAKGGAILLRNEALTALKTLLAPLATVLTPNVPEAEALSGLKITTPDDMIPVAKKLLALGSECIFVKGGHLESSEKSIDLIATKDGMEFIQSQRIESNCTHGTGCTISAAITAYLAQGVEIETAIKQAKNYIFNAIKTAQPIGQGQGHSPTNHLWNK